MCKDKANSLSTCGPAQPKEADTFLCTWRESCWGNLLLKSPSNLKIKRLPHDYGQFKVKQPFHQKGLRKLGLHTRSGGRYTPMQEAQSSCLYCHLLATLPSGHDAVRCFGYITIFFPLAPCGKWNSSPPVQTRSLAQPYAPMLNFKISPKSGNCKCIWF